MTPSEAKAAIRGILQPRISKEKEAEAMDVIIDLLSGNVGEEFPDWTDALIFQTDGTDDGRNCRHPDSEGNIRIWETKVDDNEDNEPPTDPEVTEDSFWKEISAAIASAPQQSIFKTKSVVAASAAALGVAYTALDADTLEANANGAFPQIDNRIILLNEDILLKDESTSTNNGIWKLVVVGSAGAKWKLSRRSDALSTGVDGPMYANSLVYVKDSPNSPNIHNAGKIFQCSATASSVVIWHEYDHEFVVGFPSTTLTPGDVVKSNFAKISNLTTEVPFAVFIKGVSGSGTVWCVFRKSGLMHLSMFPAGTFVTGWTMYVQSSGVLSNTVTRRPFGVMMSDDRLLIFKPVFGLIDDDSMTDNSALFAPSQKSAKAYADNILSGALAGLKWKEPCRVATTANITLSGAQTIDGVSVIAGDRVLVKDQSTASQNGIYVCASGAWSRATDGDSAAELQSATVPVNEGTANADTTWRQSTDSITLGSSSIVWVTFAASVPDATESTKGKAEIATQSETDAATDDTRIVTPLKLGLKRVDIVIPSANILNAFTSPIELIPAPGANKFIAIEQLIFSMVYNSSAYTTNTTIVIKIGGQWITLSGFLNASADVAYVLNSVSMQLSTTGLLINGSVSFTIQTGNPAAGNSNVRVRVWYRVIDM